jgi:hypothetical protein
MSVSSDLKKVHVHIAKFEKETDAMRRVISVLLEKSSLEPEEKKELALLLVVEKLDVEEKIPQIHYEKTIQQLIDEK